MSKWLGRIAGMFRSGSMVGKDKAGNRYFTRNDEVDGILKEKRWVVFKGEEDPTSVPVEWICWLNGQRKKAPTAEEIIELEAKRERVRQNVALLKKEEEERKAREGTTRKVVNTGKGGPDLKSFIRQFPGSSEGDKHKDETNEMDGVRTSKEKEAVKQESTEPTGSGQTFKPGTWQPPT
ncbi:PREDICTED: mimitin, mitochondrial [Fragaria vesca subsp. vesca]|uniref:mimitin, mitochondrial n=1 Tax=Fragaria vesca subsp. vesca TaxID=101020 RepID=UPI0002C3635C|nr:PREDICTED: mimitin, mitochondrial [Fragaria vesca subsp. vesca]